MNKKLISTIDFDGGPLVYDEYPPYGGPCYHCGSDNTKESDPIPSMLGYGTEFYVECLNCKKISWSVPDFS